MKILGIDYGQKRIGIAVSDEGNSIAFPRVVLENNKSFLEKLGEIISSEKIEKIVLGESKDFKMKDNSLMKDIHKLKEKLENEFKLKVILFSEVLSSHQVAKMMGEKNAMIDASAAAIILQSYLDSL